LWSIISSIFKIKNKQYESFIGKIGSPFAIRDAGNVAKSNELKARGIDVINLSVGEPDFFTPDHIKEAAKKAIDDNFSFYAPVSGFLDLRKAICEKLKKENGVEYKPDQIVCSNGAKHSIYNLILALVDKDEEVIIPAPYWVSYPEMVKLAEGKSFCGSRHRTRF